MMTGIFGNLSSGKSVLAVKLCYEEALEHNTKIISNIKLNFPYTHIPTEQLVNITILERKSEMFKESILFIDEIHNIIDARKSTSNLNQKFTQFLTQLGKLNCNLIFTSQILNSQIDLRLREMSDVFCFCMRMKQTNGRLKPLLFAKRKVDERIFIQVQMMVKVMGGLKHQTFKFVFNPQPYFKLYDTQELVILDRDRYLSR